MMWGSTVRTGLLAESVPRTLPTCWRVVKRVVTCVMELRAVDLTAALTQTTGVRLGEIKVTVIITTILSCVDGLADSVSEDNVTQWAVIL